MAKLAGCKTNSKTAIIIDNNLKMAFLLVDSKCNIAIIINGARKKPNEPTLDIASAIILVVNPQLYKRSPPKLPKTELVKYTA